MAGKPTRFAVQVFGSKGIIEMESGYLVKADLLRDSSWSPGRTGSKWETITSAGIGKPEPRTDGSYEGGHVAAITDLIDAIEKDRDTLVLAPRLHRHHRDDRGRVRIAPASNRGPPAEDSANPLSLLN